MSPAMIPILCLGCLFSRLPVAQAFRHKQRVNQRASSRRAPPPAPWPNKLTDIRDGSVSHLVATEAGWLTSEQWRAHLEVKKVAGARAELAGPVSSFAEHLGNFTAVSQHVGNITISQQVRAAAERSVHGAGRVSQPGGHAAERPRIQLGAHGSMSPASLSEASVDPFGGACLLSQSEDKTTGCMKECTCFWFQRCYPHHVRKEDGTTGENIGVCELSLSMMVSASILLFIAVLLLILAMRFFLVISNEEQYRQVKPFGVARNPPRIITNTYPVT